MTENTETNPTPDATPEQEIPPFLRDMDPEARKVVMDKLAAIKAAQGTTTESTLPNMVAEAVDAVDPAKPQGEVISGKNVDWTEYKLDFNVKHLYPEARYQKTPQGLKWVGLVDEFNSSSRDYDGAGTPRLKDGSSRHLATFLGDMLNGAEGWKLISVLPTGNRAGVLFQRAVPVILPDPIRIETTTEVEAPKDEELKVIEDAATTFNAEVVAEGEQS